MRLAREALGLQQNEVAERCGVSPQRWGNYEKGKRKPDLVTMIEFANLFGVPLDYIYRDDWSKLPYDIAKSIEDRIRPQK